MKPLAERNVLSAYGINTKHSYMPNGEVRFRLIDADGRGYVRTHAGAAGAWQKSHFHSELRETYIVQTGWIAAATLASDNNLQIQILKEGDIWTTPIGMAHNIYMSGGSVSHVVKHGKGSSFDWHTNEATKHLDELTSALTEIELLTPTN